MRVFGYLVARGGGRSDGGLDVGDCEIWGCLVGSVGVWLGGLVRLVAFRVFVVELDSDGTAGWGGVFGGRGDVGSRSCGA
jgi:hypothetical protein